MPGVILPGMQIRRRAVHLAHSVMCPPAIYQPLGRAFPGIRRLCSAACRRHRNASDGGISELQSVEMDDIAADEQALAIVVHEIAGVARRVAGSAMASMPGSTGPRSMPSTACRMRLRRQRSRQCRNGCCRRVVESPRGRRIPHSDTAPSPTGRVRGRHDMRQQDRVTCSVNRLAHAASPCRTRPQCGRRLHR